MKPVRWAVRSLGAVNLQLVGIRVDLDIARGVFVMQKQQREMCIRDRRYLWQVGGCDPVGAEQKDVLYPGGLCPW